jgi:hypothetical protein
VVLIPQTECCREVILDIVSRHNEASAIARSDCAGSSQVYARKQWQSRQESLYIAIARRAGCVRGDRPEKDV